MATVGTPAVNPTQITEMVEGYGKLVRSREANPALWQAVHRLSPRLAVAALTAVCDCASSVDLAALIYQLSESPAMLFARLGDGIAYHEGLRYAEFRSVCSANRFHAMYPDWFAWAEGDATR
jgi:hypothetical protein